MIRDHTETVDKLNGTLSKMKKDNKDEHEQKDADHSKALHDLRNSHLEELKRHNADRESREATNRAFINKI